MATFTPKPFEFTQEDRAQQPSGTFTPKPFEFGGDESSAGLYLSDPSELTLPQAPRYAVDTAFAWLSGAARDVAGLGYLQQRYGALSLASLPGLVSGVSRSGTAAMAGRDPIEAFTAGGGELRELGERAQDFWLEKISPEYMKAVQAGISDPEFGMTTIVGNAAMSLNGMMLGAGAAGSAARLLKSTKDLAPFILAASKSSPTAQRILKLSKYAPEIAGAVVGGLNEAALAAGATGVAMENDVLARSHDDLTQAPRYREIYDAAAGMPEDERQAYAKQTLAEEAGRDTAVRVGALTFVLGAPTGALMGRLGVAAAKRAGLGALPTRLESRVSTQAAVGFAAEAGQEFLQEGSQQLLTNLGIQGYADPNQKTWEGVLDSAILGGLVGGVLGGTLTPVLGTPARRQARQRLAGAGPAPPSGRVSRNPILEARLTEQLARVQSQGIAPEEFGKVARWAQSAAGGRSPLEFSNALDTLLETGRAPEDVEAEVGPDFTPEGMLSQSAYEKDSRLYAFDAELRIKPDRERREAVLTEFQNEGMSAYELDDGTLVVPQSEGGAAGLERVANSLRARVGVPVVFERKRAPAPEGIEKEAERLPGPQREKLMHRFSLAATAKPDFDTQIEAIAQAVGGRAVIAPLKGAKRAVDKVLGFGGEPEVDNLMDIVRATVEVESITDAGRAIEELGRRYTVLDKWSRNNLTDDAITPDGYRDAKFHVDLGDGLTGEVQVHLPEMGGVARGPEAHALYEQRTEIQRQAWNEGREPTPEEGAEIERINAQMRALFEPAWKRALKKAGSALAADSYFEQELAPIRQEAERRASALAPGKIESKRASGTMTPSWYTISPETKVSPAPVATANIPPVSPSTTGTPSTFQKRLIFTEVPPAAEPSIPRERAAPVVAALEGAPVTVRKDATVVIEPGTTAAVAEKAMEAAGRAAATHPESDYIEPTPAQAAAGNYAKGRVLFRGRMPAENVRVVIENVPGSKRKSLPGQPKWQRIMKHAYGYIAGTKAADGDPVDVFLGRQSHDVDLPVFVIRQMDARTGAFDEPKVVMGYRTEGEAKNAYLSEYPPNVGPRLFGGITRLSRAQFSDWVKSGDTDVPPEPISKRAMLHLRRKAAPARPPSAAATMQERFGTDLAQSLQEPGWAIITATQEALGGPDAAANVEANLKLEAYLRSKGIRFMKIRGVYQGIDQGPSYAVFAPEIAAKHLGKQYGQESILTHRGLIYMDGRITPAVHGSNIIGDAARNEDFYSELPDGTAFSMGLDFEATTAPAFSLAASKKQVSTREVSDAVLRVMKRWKGAPIVNVVPSDNEAPPHMRSTIRRLGLDGRVSGFYNKLDGKVYVIADNIDLQGMSVDEAVERLVSEEILGHYGLRAVMGPKQMDRLLDGVWRDFRNDPRMREIVNDYLDAYGDPTESQETARQIAEEFVAKSDPDTNTTLWDKIVAWFKQAARNLGWNVHWSDSDIRVLMERVFYSVRHGMVPASDVKLESPLASVEADVTTSAVRTKDGIRETVYGLSDRRVTARGFRARIEDGTERESPAMEVLEFEGSAQGLRNLAAFAAEEGKHYVVADLELIPQKTLESSGLQWNNESNRTVIQVPDGEVAIEAMFSLRSRAVGDARVEGILNRTLQPNTSDLTWGQRMNRWFREFTGVMGQSSTWLELKAGWIDSATAIDRMERMEFGGKLLDAAESAYKMVNLAKNQTQIVAGWASWGVPQYKDGVFVIRPDAKGLYDIFEPLFNTPDGKNLEYLWGGYAVARSIQDRIDQGHPAAERLDEFMPLADREALIDLEQQHPVFAKVFDDYQQFNQDALNLAVDRGAISREEADLWIKNAYVPLYRAMEEEEVVGGIRRKRGFSGQKLTSKRLTGSDRRINNVLENIVLNTAAIADKVYHNEAMRRIVALSEKQGVMTKEPIHYKAIQLTNEEIASRLVKTGLFVGFDSDLTSEARARDPDMYKRDLEKAVRLVESLTPEQREQYQTFFRPTRPYGADIVSVSVAGKLVYYRVHDPLVLRAIMDMTPVSFGGLINFMGGAKSLLTTMVTLDPGFMTANYLRDTLSTWITVGADVNPLAKITQNIHDIWTQSGIVADLAMAGGMTGGFYSPTDGFALTMRRVKPPKGAKVLANPKEWLQGYLKFGLLSEQLNRVATAQAVLARGGSMAEAAYQAQDVLNFAQRGDSVAAQLLIRTVPFLNARIQGLYRLYKGARGLDQMDRERARMHFWMKSLALAAVSLLLALKNRDDPRYQQIPDDQKDMYWHLFIGDEWFAIPKPFEIGVIAATLPERFVRLAMGDDRLRDTLGSLERALGETLAFNPIPQAVKPVIEQWANRTFFTGRRVVGADLEGLEPQAQYHPWTSETARGVADMMEQVVGVGVSPVRMEHLVRAYMGTLGSYLLQISDAAVRQSGAYPQAPAMKDVRDIPAIGGVAARFWRGDPELAGRTKYSDDFYDALDAAEASYRTLNAYINQGRLIEAEKLAEKRVDNLSMRKLLNGVRSSLRDINAQQRNILNSDLTPEDKREALDDLTRDRNRLMREIAPYLAAVDW